MRSSATLRLVRPLHTHSVAHNRRLRQTMSVVLNDTQGYHRKAEQLMRTIVEVARDGCTTFVRPHCVSRP